MDKIKEIEKLKKQIARIEQGEKRGGKRDGAGRPPLPEKAIQCYAYIAESKVTALGGREATQEIMKKAVDTEHEKLKIITK